MRNNRSLGHNTERSIIKKIADTLGLEAFNGKNHSTFQIGSTRLMSKLLDALKIDISFQNTKHPISKCSIQIKHCTTTTKKIDVSHLDTIEGDNRILITVTSEKKKDRYYKTGEYVTISLDDYLKLIKDVGNTKD